MSPTLLVISGLPAAGKTTLATFLARELSWPLVTKDEYKQILLQDFPEDLRALRNKDIGKVSFSLMWHVAGVTLAAGHSTILETHFYLQVSEKYILERSEKYGASLHQIYCYAPLPELSRRHAARVAAGTRPGIDFPFIYEDLPTHACWEPLKLAAPLLRLDTTQPDAVTRALAWVKQQVG